MDGRSPIGFPDQPNAWLARIIDFKNKRLLATIFAGSS